ncbi:hypothetical protein P9G84_16810 [Brevibacillus centrosporus]|uniref:hypothetical protein n=1 Tax=Brevibacillus centrosporus TaxID=54910 RepID=UPI000F0A45F0|nr:hypothetical protein [Brevibacillus centrosporus]MEC2130595.1 hypothetical protein [Brevibacillus centrosporus]RNB63792.1 hypothetical protein EDM55_28490 [Brevibacillus centrosporus]
MIPLKIAVVLVCFSLLLGNIQTQIKQDSDKNGNCVNKLSEYDGFIMWDSLEYGKSYHSETNGLIRDLKVGEVRFTMAGMVCPGYQMKNGDATLAPIGTPIYRVKGYSEKFRLLVGDDLYEVRHNPDAYSLGDLFDIKGKVFKVTLETDEENPIIKDFTDDASKQFMEELLKLKYVGFQQVYKSRGGLSGEKYFIRIYLQDRSSVLISYWIDENVLTPGVYGNEVTQNIVRSQIDSLP